MDTLHDQQQYLQTIALVLQDLECFITQKNNQSLIYALLEIKKVARKSRNHPPTSIDRKSNASQSHKNYSARKSSFSVHSAGKSVDKQSQASFDIIKGAQIFSQTSKKGIHHKLYTETLPQNQQYFSRENQQPSTLSHQNQYNPNSVSKNNEMVPKLVGLVSQEEISDIEQPFGTESRNYNHNNIRHYQKSIQEVDDEDDEFQDIVLNRLDLIEQKVNEMLREKKNQRLSTLKSHVRLSQPYHLSKSKLQNVGSGPNIISSKNRNKTGFYQYPESRYPNSTAMMSPRVYTFHNSKNASLHPSSKKITNPSFKQNLTDRIQNISKVVNSQNYFTDNEQYVDSRIQKNSKQMEDELFEQAEKNQEFLTKNKKLGHYRQSSKTLNEHNQRENMPRSPPKNEKILETTINYTRIKEIPMDDKAFKYIPLNKINSSKDNILEKTERQVLSRIPNQKEVVRKYTSQNYVNNLNTVTMEKRRQHYEALSQSNVDPHYETSYQGGYSKKNSQNEGKYRSGRDSGVRFNQLKGSEVKAYTEHGDYIKNEKNLSDTSQNGIHDEIRELREITKLYGAERQKKYAQEQRPKSPMAHIENMNSGQYRGYDYRFHQKTQRPKYPPRNRTQVTEYDEEEQVIIQSDYPKQRIVRVIKQIPHYPLQGQMVQQGRIPQRTQFVQYETHQQVVYGQPYVNESYQNPVYVMREREGPVYEQVEEIYEEPFYRGPSQSEFETVVMKEDIKSKKSHRRMSSGSMHSFKSIPYVRTEGNPSVNKEQSIEYIVQRPIRYVQKPAYQNY